MSVCGSGDLVICPGCRLDPSVVGVDFSSPRDRTQHEIRLEHGAKHKEQSVRDVHRFTF